MHNLTRAELIQISIILSNRLDALRQTIADTDYEAKFSHDGRNYAEQVRRDDEHYAHNLQTILGKLAEAIN